MSDHTLDTEGLEPTCIYTTLDDRICGKVRDDDGGTHSCDHGCQDMTHHSFQASKRDEPRLATLTEHLDEALSIAVDCSGLCVSCREKIKTILEEVGHTNERD